MTERVKWNWSLLEKMNHLTPSLFNKICECAGDYQCPYCVIDEAQQEIHRLKTRSEQLQADQALPFPFHTD